MPKELTRTAHSVVQMPPHAIRDNMTKNNDRKTQKITHDNRSREQGFTLIELSIVILIFAIMVTPLISLYARYIEEKRIITSKEILSDANTRLSTYYTRGSYPCPSDLSKGLGDPDMGVDFCGTSSFAAVAAAIPLNTCINGGGICRVEGTRDMDGDGFNDPILIGGVPFATLAAKQEGTVGIDDVARDAWGNMLFYAVSQNLTNASHPDLNRIENGLVNDYSYGVIDAKDEFGNDTSGMNGDSQFLVFSPGPNQIGAFTISGAISLPCDTTTTEGENCDQDGVFVSALGNYDANTAARYDDLIHFNKIPTGDLWGYILNTSTGTTTASIKNHNVGNVGILTTTPQAKLDVNGTLSTPSILANTYCKPSGAGVTGCLPLDFFWYSYTSPTLKSTPSGSIFIKNTCSQSYEAITSIKNGQVTCAKVSAPPAPTGPKECDSGYYMTGVRTDGCIYCSGGTSPKC